MTRVSRGPGETAVGHLASVVSHRRRAGSRENRRRWVYLWPYKIHITFTYTLHSTVNCCPVNDACQPNTKYSTILCSISLILAVWSTTVSCDVEVEVGCHLRSCPSSFISRQLELKQMVTQLSRQSSPHPHHQFFTNLTTTKNVANLYHQQTTTNMKQFSIRTFSLGTSSPLAPLRVWYIHQCRGCRCQGDIFNKYTKSTGTSTVSTR